MSNFFPQETDLQRRLSDLDESSNPRKRLKHDEVQIERSFFVIGEKIYIFTSSQNYPTINTILTNIAEPISKPAHINEFEINRSSLLRAKSLGYTYENIKTFLDSNMKNYPLNSTLAKMLYDVMNSEEWCKLYLLENEEKNFYIFEAKNKFKYLNKLDHFFSKNLKTETFQQIDIVQKIVKDYHHNELSKELFMLDIPILTEKVIEKRQIQQNMKKNVDIYKNKGALHCKNLKIELKAFTKLRDYQSEALKAVVTSNNKEITTAKSGYIVLPCGAGKTLLGIAICTKIKKETLIVCSSDSGADQWKREIEKWTQGMDRNQIIILTAKSIDDYKFHVKQSKAHIYISTYSNLKSKLEVKDKEGQIKKQIKNQHEWIKLMPWGLIIYDEAQWLPAPGNSQIANSLMAHVKIGLTATPIREDQNIKSLIYMIGPQLYVGSWKKFVQMGYLANPKCIEIRTKMTKYFNELYLNAQENRGRESKEKEALYQCNPNKIKALMYLLQYHERLNDHIIVFCDRISIINYLANQLKIPLLSGKTSTEDRNFVFDMFREGVYKTILLSRIGDQAIDLPNANVAIEINIHKGSRRQMLQRLGRIMRPKEASSSESYNALFYTIVSDQTVEMKYFRNRRQCLVNLGFQYDLRFFEYGDLNVPDILRDDREMCDYIRDKFKKVFPDKAYEEEYWNQMKNNKDDKDIE